MDAVSQKLRAYRHAWDRLSSRVGLWAKVLSSFVVLRGYEQVAGQHGQSSIPGLIALLDGQIEWLRSVLVVQSMLAAPRTHAPAPRHLSEVSISRVNQAVFSSLWTCFDQAHYDRHLMRTLNRLQALHLPFKDATVLDAGCGSGVWSVAAASLGARSCLGVDSGQENLLLATRMVGPLSKSIRFRRGDIQALPVPSGSFDVAICTGVLHHLDHPLVALRELRRALRPGGILLIYLEGRGGLFNRLWDFYVRAYQNIPQRTVADILTTCEIAPSVQIFFLDNFYALYRRQSWAGYERLVQAAGFRETQRLRGGAACDVERTAENGDPYFTEKHGTGLVRLIARK